MEQEAEGPPQAIGNEAHDAVSSLNEYARRMVTAEPLSVSTTNVGDGKRVKTIIYRRRSNSLE